MLKYRKIINNNYKTAYKTNYKNNVYSYIKKLLKYFFILFIFEWFKINQIHCRYNKSFIVIQIFEFHAKSNLHIIYILILIFLLLSIEILDMY